MQRRSSSSAGAVYLDREARQRDIEQMALRAAERIPEILRIILFGSMVSGIPTPRSDADLLIELTSSSHANLRDRIPELMRAMAPLACPVDLHVYTTSELKEFADSPVIALALQEGKPIFERR